MAPTHDKEGQVDSLPDEPQHSSGGLERAVSRGTIHDDEYRNDILHSISHVSGPDALDPAQADPYHEAGDEVYDRLSPRRKVVVVAVLSFCSLLSPISSTTVLSATPEVAAEYNTTGSIINVSNAAYMVFMGISPIVWGPMTQVFGRRPRDIYRPTERATAVGWFMSGSLIGPAFGPFLGGIIVTYSSWRSIFWLQTAMAGVGLLGVFFLVPETTHYRRIEDLKGLSRTNKAKAVTKMINPIRVLAWFRYPNLVLNAAGSAALVWNMYSLLGSIRHVLNPRFQLETPLLAGLFYLAPGCGYLIGTFMGGRWADMTVKRWIKKRGGVRVPEDRLRSTLPFVGVIIPASMLIYGWTVEMEVGGIPVPVIAMFAQGVAQLFCFPSLNTYCLDVVPGHSADVTAANFFVRYLAGCLGMAVVLPALDGIGVGWFSTISAVLLISGAIAVMAAIRWGKEWREDIDAKREAERTQRQRKHRQKQIKRAEKEASREQRQPEANGERLEKEVGVTRTDSEKVAQPV